MEFWKSFTILLVLAVSLSVTSSTITVTPPNLRLTSGQTLTIRCQETVTGTDNSLLSLGLYREVLSTSTSTDESVVGYAFVASTSTYKKTWGTNTGDLQSRVNLTETFTDANYQSGSFYFVLPEVRCEDAAAFKCMSASSEGKLPDSQVQNISVAGISQLTSLTGAQECDSFQADTDTCSNCFNFDNPLNGPKPKYAAINQELMLICTATMESSTTTLLRWYKKTANDEYQQPIIENVTDNSNTPTPGSCTHIGRSTLRYFPNSNDQELRIYCEASSQQSMNISICVQGLTVSPPQVTRAPGAQTAGLGGGPIAGIVIGVIALIVLVVVLVYFLWYKRQDSGESYNTREADGRTAPPTATKPEMHENSMYDTTGDGQKENNYHRNNKYNGQGKVNQSMDPDDYYQHDNDTAPRSRDPIGSSV